MKFSLSLFFIVLLISCGSTREKKNNTFFNKWFKESNQFTQTNISSEIENSIKAIVSKELCNYNYNIEGLKKDFPKLKYNIFQEQIKVSMFNYLGPESFTINQKERFIDSLFDNKMKCKDNNLKTLILTKKYKNKVLEKLKYGFGSSDEGKNKNNAKALIEKHHSVNFYKLPIRISEIQFNEAIDSAIVTISTTYTIIGKRYIKKNKLWQIDKELYNLVE